MLFWLITLQQIGDGDRASYPGQQQEPKGNGRNHEAEERQHINNSNFHPLDGDSFRRLVSLSARTGQGVERIFPKVVFSLTPQQHLPGRYSRIVDQYVQSAQVLDSLQDRAFRLTE